MSAISDTIGDTYQKALNINNLSCMQFATQELSNCFNSNKPILLGNPIKVIEAGLSVLAFLNIA
ncbi:hypothetical protein, partial [Arsukibacterium sp.]|uniref:hypothetical protein n=1 Tax=Arsukibacterium sp. TaxID=1977258 RepID=UPI00299F4D77